MLYFAYGSNLNIEQMKRRCPGATPLGRFSLTDARLVFRGVADCIYEAGAICEGGLWEITPQCEHALDIYEGISGGLYRKEYVESDAGPILLYQMNSTGIYPPSFGYLATIRRGYADFKLPVSALSDAVKASHDDKHPSHHERKRHRRNGRPTLAKRENSAALKLPKKTGPASNRKHARKKETT
jgi:hypothetical protein